MTKLQELREAFSEKRTHEQEANQLASSIASGIANGFREYLGLPKSWQDFDGRLRSYVQYYLYDENGSETVDASNSLKIQDALLISYENEIRFKMGIIFDDHEGAFPKQLFTFNVRSSLYGKILTINFSEFGSISCSIPEGQEWYDFTPAHDKLHSILIDNFKMRIGDKQKQKYIGFQITNV
jgi:hypothetical protein